MIGSSIEQAQAAQSRQWRTDRSRLALLIVLVIDGVIAAAAPPISAYYYGDKGPDQIPLGSGAALIAVVTFVGIWRVQRLGPSDDSLADMRNAISGAFIVVYLVILSWSAFVPAGTNTGPIGILSATFITNFTALTGVVIAFYFTTTTATHIAAYRKDQKNESKGQ